LRRAIGEGRQRERRQDGEYECNCAHGHVFNYRTKILG
jgi:hypothetical protein